MLTGLKVMKMGIIQSIICGMVLCFERVVSWTCCALVLVTLLTLVIMFTLYGISLGYNYAQKELAKIASESKSSLRAGPDTLNEPVVRLVAVNKTEGEPITNIASGQVYQTSGVTQAVFLAASATPIIVLETERPKQEIDLTPHERELARKLIGRFRRARRNSSTTTKVLTSSDHNVKSSPQTIMIVEA